MLNLGKAVGYLDLNTNSFFNGLEEATSGLDKFKNDTQKKMDAIGTSFKNVGKGLTVGFTLPIASAFAASTMAATNFNTSLAKVATIADTSVKSMEQISDEVLNLSSDVNVSANELNEALYQTISATNDTENAMSYLEIAAKLAKGGFTDTASAVDGMTSVLNAYGFAGEESAQKIADLMIMTQNLGKTTVNELNSSLSQVIPTAAAMNVSFEQISAALASVTSQGTPTAQATTQLNTLFAELGKQGTVAEENLKKAAEGTEIAGKGFSQLMSEGYTLTDVLKVMSEYAEQNGITLIDMFGSIEAGKAALQLMNQDGEKFIDSLAQMEESAGATQKAFETMSESPQEKFNNLLNTLTNLGIEIGNVLLPIVIDILEEVQKFVSWISSLNEGTIKMILIILAVIAVLGPLLSLIGTIITTISTLTTVIELAKGGMAALNAVMAANPIGAVIAIITALIAVFVTLWNKCEGFRNFWISLWNSIVSLVSSAVSAISSFIDGLITSIGGFITNMTNAGSNLMNGFWDGLKSVWESISGWFKGIIDTVTGWFNDIFGKKEQAEKAANDVRRMSIDGSHRTGLDYVPFDGYIAELHKGEKVLTADEAKEYDKGKVEKNYNINITSYEKLDEYEASKQIRQVLKDIDNLE